LIQAEDARWLEELYALAAPTLLETPPFGLASTVMDRACVYIDSLLLTGDVERCDAILAEFQPEKVKLSLSMVILVITSPDADRLPHREQLRQRVTSVAQARGVELPL
jgi:hypothetical protein